MQSALYIIGAGELGCRVASQFTKLCKSAAAPPLIFGEVSASSSRSEILVERGITPVLGREQRLEQELPQNDAHLLILYCIPPSALGDKYAEHVKQAFEELTANRENWRFVFTSSTGVYAQQQHASSEYMVDEKSEVNLESQSTKRLLDAENVVLSSGGTVLRLSGLYDVEKGAHNYYLSGRSAKPIDPDGWINQIHYDDAAEACLSVFRHESQQDISGKVFCVSDDKPMMRKSIVEVAAKMFEAKGKPVVLPSFSSDSSSNLPGKWVKADLIKNTLDWRPRYSSFADFCNQQSGKHSQL